MLGNCTYIHVVYATQLYVLIVVACVVLTHMLDATQLHVLYIYLHLRRVAFFLPLEENPDLGFGGLSCRLQAFSGFGPNVQDVTLMDDKIFQIPAQ